MRCRSCDCVLTDFEATRKVKGTQDYIDLCNRCLSYTKSAFKLEERWDLFSNKDKGLLDDPEELEK